MARWTAPWFSATHPYRLRAAAAVVAGRPGAGFPGRQTCAGHRGHTAGIWPWPERLPGSRATVHLLGRDPGRWSRCVAEITLRRCRRRCRRRGLRRLRSGGRDGLDRRFRQPGARAGRTGAQRRTDAQGADHYPPGPRTTVGDPHPGSHLITERLLPLLRAPQGASVVFVSSGGMYSTPLVVDDLESRHDYNGVR